MLTLKFRLPAELLVAENNEDNNFMGSVTENYVAQAFAANKIPLFYWKNDNTAEVDFVVLIPFVFRKKTSALKMA